MQTQLSVSFLYYHAASVKDITRVISDKRKCNLRYR